MNPWKGTVSSSSGGGGMAATDAPPQGTQVAVCIAVIDLGTHPQTYMGEKKPDAREIYFVWELPNCLRPDGRTHVVGERYKVSFNKQKAALVKMMESWRGRPYPEGSDGMKPERCVLDADGNPEPKSCFLAIEHKAGADGQVYVKVAAVTPVIAGFPVPRHTRQPFVWFIGCGQPIPEFPWLPACYGQSIPQRIRESAEYRAQPQAPAPQPAPRPRQAPAPQPAPRPRQAPAPPPRDESADQQPQDDGGQWGDPAGQQQPAPPPRRQYASKADEANDIPF